MRSLRAWRWRPSAQAEPEPTVAAVIEPEITFAPLAAQRNGNGSSPHPEAEPALAATIAVDDAADEDGFDTVTVMRRAAAAEAALPLSEDGASWVFDDPSGDVNALDVPARTAFLLVLESIGTPRSVGAIARAATNDPDIAVRSAALRTLARLVTDDGEVWAGVAAGAARTVISQRAKGEDDVARARDLLATVDVVLYEA